MSDILSTYYKSNYAIKNNVYNKRNYYTPNKIVKIDTDKTIKNLSQYGFYLSENNFILFPKKKKILPRLTINGTKYNSIKKYLEETNDSKKESNKTNNDILKKNKNEVNKYNDFIKLRNELGLTQKEMGEASNTIREIIAVIETRKKHPQINTLIKILEPFGYTLSITKIKEETNESR